MKLRLYESIDGLRWFINVHQSFWRRMRAHHTLISHLSSLIIGQAQACRMFICQRFRSTLFSFAKLFACLIISEFLIASSILYSLVLCGFVSVACIYLYLNLFHNLSRVESSLFRLLYSLIEVYN